MKRSLLLSVIITLASAMFASAMTPREAGYEDGVACGCMDWGYSRGKTGSALQELASDECAKFVKEAGMPESGRAEFITAFLRGYPEGQRNGCKNSDDSD
jgi:hypothetical protein